MTAMIHCNGCGFNVEREDVRVSTGDTHCEVCADCERIPKLREAYRRGFNAGLDAMAAAVMGVIEKKHKLRER